MEITFENLQKKAVPNPHQICKIAKTILHREGVEKSSLSIVFVTRQRIKALNKKFLHREYVTDVLAFDLTECRGKGTVCRTLTSGNVKQMIGEIIISTDAAFKNAKIYNTTVSKELTLYLIHGILHLLGFDDHKERDIQEMRKKEHELLTYLGNEAQKICHSQ